MADQPTTTRREFLITSLMGAGALSLGLVPRAGHSAGALPGAPGAWITIPEEGPVELTCPVLDFGQGVWTSLPLLIAEELRIAPDQLSVRQAPSDAGVYGNPALRGSQAVGDSRSVRGYWEPLRTLGAAAREMLVAAGAAAMEVAAEGCQAEAGHVVHAESGRRIAFGQLTGRAAQMPVPEAPTLTPRSQWRLLGRDQMRLEVPDRVTGRAIYGTDVSFEGLHHAAILHAPKLDARLGRVDPAPALALPGVTHVVPMERAVAVVADSWWRAKKGLEALDPQWEVLSHGDLDDAAIDAHIAARLAAPAHIVEEAGDAEAAYAAAAHQLDVEYDAPFLTHACMEPMNATARWLPEGEVPGKRLEVWAPTQAATRALDFLALNFEVPAEQVILHTTFAGTGFGRRSHVDYILEAVEIAAGAGVPVKLLWSREEDIAQDYFRPATRARFRLGVDGAGRLSAWNVDIIGGSLFKHLWPGPAPFDVDPSVSGYMTPERALSYTIPARRVRADLWDLPIRVGPWRAVSASQNSWFRECVIDEAAHAAGRDPLAFRKAHLADQPRLLRVLDHVAKMADWERERPAGTGVGLAVADAFGSMLAAAVEVTMVDEASLRIGRIWFAIDCGTAVQPTNIVMQVEGGVNDAVQAALQGRVSFADGAVVERNFDALPWLTLDRAPAIEVAVLEDLEAPLGGVGETGVAVTGPALLNAIFAASGRRIRRLPLEREGLSLAV